MKRQIRLTESELHKLVEGTVLNIISEIGDTCKGQKALGALKARQEERGRKADPKNQHDWSEKNTAPFKTQLHAHNKGKGHEENWGRKSFATDKSHPFNVGYDDYKKKSKEKNLNEARGHWNDDKWEKWVDESHIPQNTLKIVNAVLSAVDIPFQIEEEEVLRIKNYRDQTIGYGKGFSYSYRTSSMLDGPDADLSDEIIKWLKGTGFEINNSYGDNGMDSATNYKDTWWTYDFVYKPSIVYNDSFMDFNDDDDDDWDEGDDWGDDW